MSSRLDWDIIDLSEHGDASFDGFDPSKSQNELGLTVYHDLWKEFYAWEPENCKKIITELASTSTQSLEGIELRLISPVNHGMDIDTDDLDFCSLTTFLTDGSASHSRAWFQDISVEKYIPHPPYESCTPTVKNIARRPNISKLSFIPYQDDPEFDLEEYTHMFGSFTWQISINPDLEVIQLEAARRLHFRHKFSFSEIDQLGLLRTLRADNKSGLIWNTSQYDILNWPGSFSDMDRLPTVFNCRAEDLRTRLNSILAAFCPLLGCIQSYCPTHATDYAESETKKPVLTNTSLRLSEGEPCGNYCFKLVSDTFMDLVYWENEADMETLKTVLSIQPDIYPCDLAVICHKPCREVFVQRSRLFPEGSIFDTDDTQFPLSRRPKFNDIDHNEFTLLSPCHHKGACNSESSCPCFQNNLHCQRSCRCSQDCYIRWKGCDCRQSSKSCTTTKCKCRKARRECDPDLCITCDARYESFKPCRNTKTQRGPIQILEIKRGKYGLGAFATRDVSVGELLGEYVGELISKNDAYSFDPLRTYSGLNYMFTIDESNIVDAARVGNETRYINHGGATNLNCEAVVASVNGEHRIGIFTVKKVRRGEEFLLDYGDAYWEGKVPGE